MTSRERVLTALEHRQPDRVPYMEIVVDSELGEQAVLGSLIEKDESFIDEYDSLRQGFLGIDYYTPEQLAEAFSLDAVGYFIMAPQYVETQPMLGGRNCFTGGKIKTRKDLRKIQLPDPDDPSLFLPAEKFVEEHHRADFALFALVNLGSDPVILSMGMENFSIALYDDPTLVEELFELYADWMARAMKHICSMGFDFVWAGDDIAFKSGPMFSPGVFKKLILPHYRRVAENISLPWVFHSDGNLMPIIDDLLSLGMNGLHPIEPGAMDLKEMKRRYGRKVCLVGNISLNLLSRGTPQEVEKAVQEAISTAAPGGGYILSSGNSLASYCKLENALGMVNAVKKYGHYPISIEGG